MGYMFHSKFGPSIVHAPPVHTLANNKQKVNESLKEYFRRFNHQVPKVKQASEEMLIKFLIAEVWPGTDFWKELHGKEPKTQADFYAKVEYYRLIKESIMNLAQEWNNRGRNN